MDVSVNNANVQSSIACGIPSVTIYRPLVRRQLRKFINAYAQLRVWRGDRAIEVSWSGREVRLSNTLPSAPKRG